MLSFRLCRPWAWLMTFWGVIRQSSATTFIWITNGHCNMVLVCIKWKKLNSSWLNCVLGRQLIWHSVFYLEWNKATETVRIQPILILYNTSPRGCCQIWIQKKHICQTIVVLSYTVYQYIMEFHNYIIWPFCVISKYNHCELGYFMFCWTWTSMFS